MKKYRLINIVLAALLVLASCNKEAVGPVISDPTAPAITAPAAGLSIVLTETNATTDTLKFAWTAATNYGFAAAVTYKVQMSMPGDNFANPTTIITANALKGSLTYGELNNLMMAAELAPAVAADLQFRVVAIVSELVPGTFSGVLALSAKPFRVIVNYPKIYVPGSYQGWAPDKAPVLSSLLSDKKYEGYINFPEAGAKFKFTPQPNWDSDWGDTGGDGTLEVKGTDIAAPGAGYFKINVDIPKLTYTMVKTVWGIVGDATGSWDIDQVMTFDASAGTWSKTLDLAAGKIKFRANGAWGIDFGDNKTNLSLEYGGADIPIASAGNYKITLDLRGPIYTYVIKKN
jgi:hypothetical protein